METTKSNEEGMVTGKDSRPLIDRSIPDRIETATLCHGLILGARRSVLGHQGSGSNASGVCRGERNESHLSQFGRSH